MKNYTHLVDMRCGDGVLKGMKAIIEDGIIHFVRNENGVHAWHCNNVDKYDSDVLKITKVK